MSKRGIWFFRTAKAVSLVLFCGVLYYLFRRLEVDVDSVTRFTENYIRSLGLWGYFAYFLLCGIATFFFTPRQLLSLVAGYFYGVFPAVVMVSFGAGLGCLLSMGYGNFLAGNFFRTKMKSRVQCLENIFARSTFWTALGIRILPVGSNTLLNMVVGATKIPFWSFWAGSVLGYIPQNLIFALLGRAGKTENDMTVLFSACLYVLLFLAGFLIVKKNLPKNITLSYLYNGIVKGKE